MPALYQASCHFYRAFKETKDGGVIPEDNLRIVTYPQLMQNLEETMEELVRFAEVDPGPQFWSKVKEQAEKQREYRSEHKYSLEKFGLSEERIRRDLEFVYRDYGI